MNFVRKRISFFLANEVQKGGLAYSFKASVYAQDINSKLKFILESMPGDISHSELSAFYTERMLIEAVEKNRPFDKLLLDLSNIEKFIKMAKEPKKSVPAKVNTVLFVTSIFPSVEHGGGLKTFDTIQELAVLGYKVSLYSHYNESVDKKSYMDLLPSLTHVRLVDVETFGEADFKDWLVRGNLTFDLGHYVWPHSCTLIPTDHNRIKCHVFEFIETTSRRCMMEIDEMLKDGKNKKLGAKLFELVECTLLEAQACARSDKFICITEKDAEFSRDLFKIAEPAVVQIGVSRHAILDRLKDSNIVNIQTKPLTVGFIGNYNHYPNIDGIEWYLDNVHPKVLAKVPNYVFHVIGFGLPNKLKEKYRHGSINFVGPVDNVIEALKPLQVCVAPLISGAGFRVKLNQFSVMSKPTVSTTIGACGMPYVSGESIFISDDPSEFAEDVVTLLINPNLNSQMGLRAYEVVEKNYFWAPHIKKLVQVYES